jgi:hypothetical protein
VPSVSAVGCESPRTRAANRSRSSKGGALTLAGTGLDGPGTNCWFMAVHPEENRNPNRIVV